MRWSHSHLLYLNAGDLLQGNGLCWPFASWSAIASVVNAIGYDAITLGNHELDLGDEELAALLTNLSSTVLSSNILLNSTNSALRDALQTAKVFEIGGQQVGVVAYTTPSIAAISEIGSSVVILDEIASLRRVVAQLESRGINKIVAVGHSGLSVDEQVCRLVAGVDVVVGGHSHSFLHSGLPPSTEVPLGSYPLVHSTPFGPCLVVHAFEYGKYVGCLNVSFDAAGVVRSFAGNPVLLDHSQPMQAGVEQTLLALKSQALAGGSARVVGQSSVVLVGDRVLCRLHECSLGDFLTDAFLWAYTTEGATVALLNSGNVGSASYPSGSYLLLHDVEQMNPHRTTLLAARMSGRLLRAVLEHSVEDYNSSLPRGKFLQLSGLRVSYDISRPGGRRVEQVETARGLLGEQQELWVVLSDYLLRGGDGYSMLRDANLTLLDKQLSDVSAVLHYLTVHPVLGPLATGRIVIR